MFYTLHLVLIILIIAGCAAPFEAIRLGSPAESPDDAIWFKQYTMQNSEGKGFVAVNRDGSAIYIERIGANAPPGQVRAGQLPADLRDQLFDVAQQRKLYTTRVSGQGELLFL